MFHSTEKITRKASGTPFGIRHIKLREPVMPPAILYINQPIFFLKKRERRNLDICSFPHRQQYITLSRSCRMFFLPCLPLQHCIFFLQFLTEYFFLFHGGKLLMIKPSGVYLLLDGFSLS